MFFPTGLIAIFIALISGYGLFRSGSSIPKLQKYEEKAKKAAEWSAAAEKRLWDTRYTVGAGFTAVRHLPRAPAPSGAVLTLGASP